MRYAIKDEYRIPNAPFYSIAFGVSDGRGIVIIEFHSGERRMYQGVDVDRIRGVGVHLKGGHILGDIVLNELESYPFSRLYER